MQSPDKSVCPTWSSQIKKLLGSVLERLNVSIYEYFDFTLVRNRITSFTLEIGPCVRPMPKLGTGAETWIF